MNEIVLKNSCMPVLTSCGHLSAHESFYHADRTVDFNIIIYCIKGKIYVTEDGIDYEIGEGDMILLKSGLHHLGKKEIKRGTEWLFAHFVIADNGYFGESIELPKLLRNVQGTEAQELFEKLIKVNDSDDIERNWFRNSNMFALLSKAALYNRKKQKPVTIADKISRYISENYSKPFSASVLEDKFYLSYKYMAYIFKRSKGITMQQFQTKLRIDHACRLLDSSMLTVGEIANVVGYNDMLYFSRIFKRETGLSPTDFRKRLTIHQKGF